MGVFPQRALLLRPRWRPARAGACACLLLARAASSPSPPPRSTTRLPAAPTPPSRCGRGLKGAAAAGPPSWRSRRPLLPPAPPPPPPLEPRSSARPPPPRWWLAPHSSAPPPTLSPAHSGPSPARPKRRGPRLPAAFGSAPSSPRPCAPALCALATPQEALAAGRPPWQCGAGRLPSRAAARPFAASAPAPWRRPRGGSGAQCRRRHLLPSRNCPRPRF
mmetsp:Transcript_62441/g.122669  ORF Transcript_62441/g.122669 Transcript_62441/m.122669 type:complete len:219 (-) Transcript_62441:1424-2080(-)